MAAPPERPPGVIAISELVARCRGIAYSTFAKGHPDAFLLYGGPQESLRPTEREWQHTQPTLGRRAGAPAARPLDHGFVYPMPESVLEPWTVTIGRVRDNDIIVPDESVSVYHAVLKRGARGEYLIRDAGSRTGTFVNEAPISDERPTELRAGDVIRIGSVALAFLPANELYHLARQIAAAASAARSSLRFDELFSDLTPTASGAHPLGAAISSLMEAIHHIDAGKYSQGRRLLDEILARDPQNNKARIWSHIAEARLCRDTGDPAGAAAAYQEVLRIDPDHPEARRALAALFPSSRKR